MPRSPQSATPNRTYLVNQRVKLICCTDPYVSMPQGMEGTVKFVDALDTVHVQWDDGRYLGMCHAAGDRFIVLNPDPID